MNHGFEHPPARLSPHMNPFNLVTSDWIPVRMADGTSRLASLDAAFRHGHEIADLDCAPHERISLMRLLVCITHAALGAPDSPEDWGDFGDELETAAPDYLHRQDILPHFNLLGDGPRFLQVPVKSKCDPVPSGKLIFHFASGNNTTLFDHEGDNPHRHMPAGRIALALLSFQAFHPLYGKGHKGKGPCVDHSMLHTLCTGETLAATILANCLSADMICEHFPDVGRPVWELDASRPTDRQVATTSCLGRLVPRHRDLWLAGDCTGFFISTSCMEYPLFEAAREPSATVIALKKSEAAQRGLLSCRLDRAIWRDLHNIAVFRHAATQEGCAPLNLLVRHRREGGAIRIWTGGIIADKGKIIDAIESTFTIPAKMLREEGRGFYASGVEFADIQSKRLYLAVKTYGDEMKSASAPVAAAQRHFWHALDRDYEVLLDLVRDGSPMKFEERGNPWGDLVREAARKAYDHACPRQTPRQIQAFAAGLKKLPISKTKPSKEKQ